MILPTLPHLAELLHPALFFTQGSGADSTLVINLLSSLPGSIETSTTDDNGRTKWMNVWNSQDDAHQEELRRAEQKLDNFMNEVIRSKHRRRTSLSSTLYYLRHVAIPSVHAVLISGDHPESCCIQRHRHLRRAQGRLPTLRFLKPRHGVSGDLFDTLLPHAAASVFTVNWYARPCRRTNGQAMRHSLPSLPSSPTPPRSNNKRAPIYIHEWTTT